MHCLDINYEWNGIKGVVSYCEKDLKFEPVKLENVFFS